VFGNDAAVAFAGSQGNFQLNVYKPVMVHNLLESTALLADACHSFNEHCARGIEPNAARIAANLHNSLMPVTALNPYFGYEKAARISLTAHREGITLREAARKLGHVTAEQFDAWVRPEDMTHPLAEDSAVARSCPAQVNRCPVRRRCAEAVRRDASSPPRRGRSRPDGEAVRQCTESRWFRPQPSAVPGARTSGPRSMTVRRARSAKPGFTYFAICRLRPSRGRGTA
jgi:transposase-like protein